MTKTDNIDRALELMTCSKPRTPEHMKKVLGLIEEAWMNAPGLRLMQLIINVADIKGENSSIFHLEDEELEGKLLKMSKNECTADK